MSDTLINLGIGTTQSSLIDISAASTEGAAGAAAPAAPAAKPVLGGPSLSVSSSSSSIDLEALLEKLRAEQEDARKRLLMNSLASISDSLTETQKRQVQEGLDLSQQLADLQKSYDTTASTTEYTDAQKDAITLQTKIDALQTQIDLAIQEGKDHNEQVQEQEKLRKELDEKNKVIKDYKDKLDNISSDMAGIRAQISNIVTSVGAGQLKTIASELASITGAEKATSPADEAKKEAKAEENDPFSAIHDSLEKIRDEILDTIDKNTTKMV